MTSFQIGISPHRRVAGRFLESVRRTIQRALVEEQTKNGISQSDIARALGVHRSVINREIRGVQDLTLSRVAQIAWALGRVPRLTFEPQKRNGNYFPTTDQTPVVRSRANTATANTNSQDVFSVSSS